MWCIVIGSGSSGMYSPAGFWSRTAPRSTRWSRPAAVGAHDVGALVDQLQVVAVGVGEDVVEEGRHRVLRGRGSYELRLGYQR